MVPVVYNWNLTIERQLFPQWLLRAAYVGSHGSHIRETVALNPARYIPGSPLSTDQRRLFQGFGTISLAARGLSRVLVFGALEISAKVEMTERRYQAVGGYSSTSRLRVFFPRSTYDQSN